MAYLYTCKGYLYLTVVTNLYSRAVVGWPMIKGVKASLITGNLTIKMFQRAMP